MNSNILVSEQKLRDTAQSFRSNVSKMRTVLADSTANINKTSSIWTGGAADALRVKYDTFKANFEPFCETVEGFAKFLDAAAEEYAAKEKMIEQAASNANV